MKLKRMTYTKDNGEKSNRLVVVVAEPKDNFLCYDVSKLTDKELQMLAHYLNSIDDYRDETLKEFEDITDIQFSRLWRSFKPGGIEWDDKDDYLF